MSLIAAKSAALTMRKIDAASLQEDSDGSPHWYLGEQNLFELYFVEVSGEIKIFNGCIQGTYFESNRPGELRFGEVTGGAQPGHYPQAKIISYDDMAPPEFQHLAQEFVENIPGLESDFKRQILNRMAI
jgi:hypothetical protein